MDFTRLEKKIVNLAATRYQRWFYRWGHLLGWLATPLVILMYVPALKPCSDWLAFGAVLLLFEWYHVVTTRVIGKLNAARPADN